MSPKKEMILCDTARCCLLFGLNEATYRHPFPNVGVCLCYANSPPCRAREASMTTIFAEFFVEWVCVGVVVCNVHF